MIPRGRVVQPGTSLCRALGCLHVSKAHKNKSVVQHRCHAIKLICTDVDGTLLNSNNELSEAAKKAIKDASNAGIPTAVTTGKSKGRWIDEISEFLPDVPAVYLQGCMVVDAQDNVIAQEHMDQSTIERLIEFADRNEVTPCAYVGTRIITTEANEHTDIIYEIKEPAPEGVGSLKDKLLGEDAWDTHKVALLGPHEKFEGGVADKAKEELGDVLDVTMALPGILECLPKGANKADGVKKLLKHMKIEPEEMMALGDGSNDAGLLKMAGVSVAMGSGSDACKEVATWVAPSNDDDGFAVAVNKMLNGDFD